MAFWRVGANFASLNAVSGINKLLEKPDCTLAELFEEDDILQELREHNAKLIEFLREPRNLQQLLRYISHWSQKDNASEISSSNSSNGSISESSNSEGAGQNEVVKEKGSEDKDKQTIDGSENATQDGYVPSNPFAKDREDGADDLDTLDDDEDLGLTRIAASPEPDSSGLFDEEKAWRCARLSTEIFSAEIWSIYETVMRETALLEEFWTFLDSTEPLDPVYAGYFAKTNEQFLDRKTEQMIEFLKTLPNLVEKFMKHIDTPAIMDLLLKILCTDKPDSEVGIIETLQEQQLIPRLISFLSADTTSNTQSAAGDFLKALITISANASNDFTSIGPNELTRELVSPEIMTQLANQMVTGGGMALAAAVGVIIELIRKNNSDYDLEQMMNMTLESHPPSTRDPIYLGYLLKILAQNIPKFQGLLVKKRDVRMATSFGVIEPLGFERFKICELIAELLHCSNMVLLNDPHGEEIATERDRVRKQQRLLKVDEDNEISFLDNEECVSDLRRSVGHLSVTDQISEVSAGSSSSWFGKRKDSGTSSTDSGESNLPIIADQPLASSELSQDNTSAAMDLNTGAEHSRDLSKEEGVDADLPSTRELYAASDAACNTSAQSQEVATQGDLDYVEMRDTSEFSEDPNELVIGDFLKYQLIKYRVVSTIVKLFFKFPWNNFLHNVVFDVIQQIFNGPMDRGYNRYLAIELFKTDRITDQIIDGTNASNEHEASTRMRLGYMGHLTLISEEIVKFLQRYPPETLSQDVVEATIGNERWNYYVNETLMQTRIRDNSILGGQRPNSEIPSHHLLSMSTMDTFTSSGVDEDEDEDDNDVAAEYSNEDGLLVDDKDDDETSDRTLNQLGLGQSNNQWSRYMSQQMTPDRFGSSDEDDEDEEQEEEDMSSSGKTNQIADQDIGE
ncbi:SIT4 phosphatase-associated protein-domain-containing protein [Dipodascopsis uninucleata]